MKQGQDVRVTVRDKDGTTLWIEWMLCNRATLYQLVSGTEWSGAADIPFADVLQQAGFKQVKCLDPYAESGARVVLAK